MRGDASPAIVVPTVKMSGAVGAALVTALMLVATGQIGDAPVVEAITCQADMISTDGFLLVGDRCWSLSSEGASCAEACGSGAAVDAEATVRGSGDADVQRALARVHPGALTWLALTTASS